MINQFEMICYKGTESEITLNIKIGIIGDLFPDDKNYNSETTYGYKITTIKKGTLGISHLGFTNRMKAQASALLCRRLTEMVEFPLRICFVSPYPLPRLPGREFDMRLIMEEELI